MITEPKLETLPAKHFAVIRLKAPIPFDDIIQPTHQEVITWLQSQGLAPSGPSIIRYLTTNMDTALDLEIGWPVAAPIEGDGRVSGVTLPAGRYLVSTYTGNYDGLYNATTEFVTWADENKIVWDTYEVDGEEWWTARYEFYRLDPGDNPDPSKWETDLIFLTKES